jgi:hypothetical protein
MKRLILLIALIVLAMILARLPSSVVSDTSTSLTDSNIPDNEITTSQTESDNSSASATITITITGILSGWPSCISLRATTKVLGEIGGIKW